MSQRVELLLSDDVAAQIDTRAVDAGVSREEWIGEALKARLFIDEFREVRERLLKKLEARGERYTDEDIFKMVS